LFRRDASCDDWNQETQRDALSHFVALTQFPFTFALSVTKEVLGDTKALSIKLQGIKVCLCGKGFY